MIYVFESWSSAFNPLSWDLFDYSCVSKSILKSSMSWKRVYELHSSCRTEKIYSHCFRCADGLWPKKNSKGFDPKIVGCSPSAVPKRTSLPQTDVRSTWTTSFITVSPSSESAFRGPNWWRPWRGSPTVLTVPCSPPSHPHKPPQLPSQAGRSDDPALQKAEEQLRRTQNRLSVWGADGISHSGRTTEAAASMISNFVYQR